MRDNPFEERYRTIYAAGVSCATGRDPNAWAHYRAFLEQSPDRGRLIDFGCGEGSAASLAADLGYQVTAIDSAPSAVARAQEIHRSSAITFVVADVCDLDALPSASFDTAVDLGCMHVIADDHAVRRYLAHAYRLLAPGGRAYYQNFVPADDAQAWFPHEAGLVEWWRQRIAEAASTTSVTRTYEIDGRAVDVEVPLIPAAKRELREQVSLLSEAGLAVQCAGPALVLQAPGSAAG